MVIVSSGSGRLQILVWPFASVILTSSPFKDILTPGSGTPLVVFMVMMWRTLGARQGQFTQSSVGSEDKEVKNNNKHQTYHCHHCRRRRCRLLWNFILNLFNTQTRALREFIITLKKKEFCLVLSHLALESTPVQFTPYPLSHHISPSLLLLSVRFLRAIRIWQEFLTANVRRAFHVKVATNVTTRRHMWHLVLAISH